MNRPRPFEKDLKCDLCGQPAKWYDREFHKDFVLGEALCDVCAGASAVGAKYPCCAVCKHLIENHKPPKGERFYNEYRCEIFPFIFWYQDNTKGILNITCTQYESFLPPYPPNKAIEPAPYNLSDNSEKLRLLRESKGYLKTCLDEHHGTDFQGRQFAFDALNEWLKELK